MKLGAASAFGVDTDPVAEEATLANARRNRLVRRVRAREGSLPSGEPAFDVVLANLIAGVLVPWPAPLREEFRPGGILLASGIFHDREAAVGRAFEAAGLGVTERTAEGDWVALEARRAPESPVPYDRPRCPRLFPILLVAHIALAVCLFLPSILLPFTLRTRRATVESDSRVVQGLL